MVRALCALAALAVLVGILLVVVGSDERTSVGSLAAEDSQIAARDAWCRSPGGRSLVEKVEAAPPEPTALRQTTDDALELAAQAPAGTGCAVASLDALVLLWQAASARGEERESQAQIARIRALQKREQLAHSQY